MNGTGWVGRNRSAIYRSRYLLLMFLPAAIYFVVFKYGPMFGLLMAFKDYNPIRGILGSPWVGFKYFRDVFSDPWFYKVFRNTIVLNLYMLGIYFWVPIILALLINEVRSPTYKKVVQTISYLPFFLSTVVIAGMVTNFLSSAGLINRFLQAVGHDPVFFMLKPGWFRIIYVFTVMWQNSGWDTIIFLAALTGVDPGLYEAAILDGANRWQRVRYITIPSIVPVISIVFLLRVGQMLTVGFERVLLLYNPSVYETADVIQTYVYRRAMVQGEFSYGTAVDLLSGVIAFALVVTANRVARRLGGSRLW